MTYDEKLVKRVRDLVGKKKGMKEKNMFGGVSFLLNGKMSCGVLKDNLVVRVNPEEQAAFLKKPHVKQMNFTGRVAKGFLYIRPQGYNTDEKLEEWVERSVQFVSKMPKKKK